MQDIMKAMAHPLHITGLEIYSAIRAFRHAHENDPDFHTAFQDHLMKQVDALIGKIAHSKNELWLANRNVGIANSKLAKADLMREQDAFRIEELKEEVAWSKLDKTYRDRIERLIEARREIMLPDGPYRKWNDSERIAEQAQIADAIRHCEDVWARDRERSEELLEALRRHRLSIDADLANVPDVLDLDAKKSEKTPAQDPFNSTPVPRSKKDAKSSGTLKGSAVVQISVRESPVSKGSAAVQTSSKKPSFKKSQSTPRRSQHDRIKSIKESEKEVEDSFCVDTTQDSFDVLTDGSSDNSSVADQDETFATTSSTLDLGVNKPNTSAKVEDDAESVCSEYTNPDKENRPVLSTPPGSPGRLDKHDIPGCPLVEHDDCIHPPIIAMKKSSSSREPLGTLYDEATTADTSAVDKEPAHAEFDATLDKIDKLIAAQDLQPEIAALNATVNKFKKVVKDSNKENGGPSRRALRNASTTKLGAAVSKLKEVKNLVDASNKENSGSDRQPLKSIPTTKPRPRKRPASEDLDEEYTPGMATSTVTENGSPIGRRIKRSRRKCATT